MTEAEMQRQEAVVEAVLFTMGKSVETSLLAAALECTAAEAEAAAERLAARYAEANRGVQLLRLENAWQLGKRAAAAGFEPGRARDPRNHCLPSACHQDGNRKDTRCVLRSCSQQAD